MKLRFLIRTAVLVSVVLLCAGVGVYSFLRLDVIDSQREVNLYTLVPKDAVAVLETDRMAGLVEDIDQMQCSIDNHFLYVSELFVCLKKYFYTWAEEIPHGLSRQMNKMMISFHEPDTPLNQVLYCSLGAGDYELMESFIRKYTSATYPFKESRYKGKSVRVYPMPDGRFLAVYATRDFLVVSFQKRLVEQVIETTLEDTSLMAQPAFQEIYDTEHHHAASLYVRMKSVGMGKEPDDSRSMSRLGSWVRFDMKMGEQAIYCSGISHTTDSLPSFVNALSRQQPVSDFPGNRLPGSTFFYTNWALSDKSVVSDFMSRQEYARRNYSDYVKRRDEEWAAFMNDYASDRVMSCLFFSKDTADLRPCAVMSIPVTDEVQAGRRLRALLCTTPPDSDVPVPDYQSPQYDLYPLARPYRQYLLPRNTLLTQMTGITESALYTYSCFYRGEWLLAPDARSLSAYIDALERGLVLEGMPLYEEGVGSLSLSYNFLMMIDMEQMVGQPEDYSRLVPNFFFRRADFFRHFMLSIQFTCADGMVYPNIVMIYKG